MGISLPTGMLIKAINAVKVRSLHVFADDVVNDHRNETYDDNCDTAPIISSH